MPRSRCARPPSARDAPPPHDVGTRIAIHASQGLVGQRGRGPADRRRGHVRGLCGARDADRRRRAGRHPGERRRRADARATVRARARRAPATARAATGSRGSSARALAPRGPMTPLVGRGLELELLRRAAGPGRAGHGQIVAIVGEPGVGKSRLVWEVAQAHRTQGWLVLHATTLSYGQATPYLPVIELLKAYFRIEDRDDPPTIREKVTGRLLALDPALEPNLSALLALLDVPVDDSAWQALDPSQRRQRTLRGDQAALAPRGSGPAPAPRARGPPLGRFRDAGAPRRPRREPPDRTALPPDRLSPRVSARLGQQDGLQSAPPRPVAAGERARAPRIRSSADDPGLQRLKALLIERTEGNPFFLEETVQTLAETERPGRSTRASIAGPTDRRDRGAGNGPGRPGRTYRPAARPRRGAFSRQPR